MEFHPNFRNLSSLPSSGLKILMSPPGVACCFLGFFRLFGVGGRIYEPEAQNRSSGIKVQIAS